MSLIAENGSCPCGRTGVLGTRAIRDCCGQYIAGGAPAPDPESLMRSRYTAFVLRDEGYLLRTWAANTRPESIDFDPQLQWCGLTVHASESSEDRGNVRFTAFFRRGRGGTGSRMEQQEHSRFVREAGAWLYLDDQGRVR